MLLILPAKSNPILSDFRVSIEKFYIEESPAREKYSSLGLFPLPWTFPSQFLLGFSLHRLVRHGGNDRRDILSRHLPSFGPGSFPPFGKNFPAFTPRDPRFPIGSNVGCLFQPRVGLVRAGRQSILGGDDEVLELVEEVLFGHVLRTHGCFSLFPQLILPTSFDDDS